MAGSVSMDGHAVRNSTTGNLLIDYYDRFPAVVSRVLDDPQLPPGTGDFCPGFDLPELRADIREFLSAATVRWQELGSYQGHRLVLLDLAGNPATCTTKTYPSLLIVARAVEHVRRTGENLMIFSPTSGNKGTALRDAVLRSIESGLVEPEQLRVVTLVPSSSQDDKLFSSRLAADPELRRLNPLLLNGGEPAEGVKGLGRAFVRDYAAEAKRQFGVQLWFTLELRNYLIADAARAFFEHSAAPEDGRPRVHAHAVSSAFGLLGYHLGRELLESSGMASEQTRGSSLIVQHLGTPDMVLNLLTGSFERSGIPRYDYDPVSGCFRQDADPHFPAVADDLTEILDRTFYTRRPPTSKLMNKIITQYGGNGIVVSRRECLDRYPLVRDWFAHLSRPLPPDPDQLREWSVVMALTGVMNAVDRGLVPSGSDLIVHGTGWYGASDYEPLSKAETVTVKSADDIAAAVFGSS